MKIRKLLIIFIFKYRKKIFILLLVIGIKLYSNYIGDFGTKYLAKGLSYLIKLTYLNSNISISWNSVIKLEILFISFKFSRSENHLSQKLYFSYLMLYSVKLFQPQAK